MLTEAVRQINSSDIARAFLQSSTIERNVYVEPPKEAGVPRSKVWKLKPPAYGFKKCDCSCSKHKSTECPKKDDGENVSESSSLKQGGGHLQHLKLKRIQTKRYTKF